jgi:hypothetical protein
MGKGQVMASTRETEAKPQNFLESRAVLAS